MPPSEVTCWSVIEGAAGGSRASRDRFAERYIPVIRAYLGARWRLPDHDTVVVEACQEVLLECLKAEGPLLRADPERSGGFRAFLYGITRNVARRIERKEGGNRERQATSHFDLDAIARAEAGASEVFDRAWIQMLIQQAMDRLADRGPEKWSHPVDRVELLRLRYDEARPPREIATRRPRGDKRLPGPRAGPPRVRRGDLGGPGLPLAGEPAQRARAALRRAAGSLG